MSTHLLGDTVTVQALFKDVNGNLVDPSGVTYTLTPPPGSTAAVTTYYWHVSPNPDSPQLIRDSTGTFHVDNEPSAGGSPWRWEFASTSPTQRAQGGSFTVIDPTQSGWPAPWGYCDVADIQSRINAGTWNPDASGAFPNTSMVQQWITEGAVTIDAALVRNGYFVPIVPQSGKVIMPQLWLLLRNINASFATGMVERARHGAVDESEDLNAEFWITLFDDFLTRLEQGDDNLRLFGADGPFLPVADRGSKMSVGGQTDANGNAQPPFFTKYAPLTVDPSIGWPAPPDLFQQGF